MIILVIGELDKPNILSEEIFKMIFETEDEIERAHLILALTDRAEDLKVKGKFETILKAYKKVDLETRKKSRQITKAENWTGFVGEYEPMWCGSWIASDEGIYMQSMNGLVDILACYHPILPVERLKNLETGEEQIKLAFKRNNRWEEIIVPKTLVTSANKITSLSGRGIAVTSENAKYLVRYLADVENGNEDDIKVQYSSSKLGWIKDGFIPYNTDIIFDGDSRFKQLFESIHEEGDKALWYSHIKELRATGRMEIKFMLAASFASVLVGLLKGLPFFADLWGETEGGKTVTLMLSSSVWGNPDESRYIGDFKTTEVALEAKADMLNNLPMILDDTSKTSARIRDNFEGFVYDLCSGKGKSRSNKDLGINRENRWRNAMLTSGERPLNSYVSQGGAINRILEVECGEKVYKDPQHTADLLKRNYGFAGKDFVDLISKIGIDEIRKTQTKLQKQLFNDDKMQKQSMSLAIVLTADKLVTEHLFKDSQHISLDEAKSVLMDRNELSDNERCYRYLQDKIAMNNSKFDSRANCEQWGVIDENYAIIYSTAFDQMCKDGGFSRKSFLSWAEKRELIQTSSGRPTKAKKIAGKVIKCVFLKIGDEDEDDKFISLDDFQGKLPFD